MKNIIPRLLLMLIILGSAVTAQSQDKKKKEDNKPPQIEIYVQPMQQNPGGMGPFVLPIGPQGSAVFPDLPFGSYQFGLYLDPLELLNRFSLPLPPSGLGGLPMPLPLPPLPGLTLGMQAATTEQKKPAVTVELETKDGKSDQDNGKGKAKAKVEQVVITVNTLPRNENQPFQVPIGQFRINADPKEGAEKNKVTIEVKFPKPDRNNTR